MKGKIPEKIGFYWAATIERFEYWDLIVQVYGRKPFLKVKIYVLNFENEYLSDDINLIEYWGDEIKEPLIKPCDIKDIA